MIPFEITVEELNEWRESGKPHRLVDVREQVESQMASIGGELIPIRTIPQHLNEFEPEEDIVVYCHVGGRSAMVVEFLRRNGFPNARSLRGGIDAWSRVIDPSIKQY